MKQIEKVSQIEQNENNEIIEEIIETKAVSVKNIFTVQWRTDDTSVEPRIFEL
jgi:hypothetical protein